MVGIGYYPDKPNANRTTIRVQITHKGACPVFLPEGIRPQFWDKDTQRLRVDKSVPIEYRSDNARVNIRLDSYEIEIKNIYHRLKDDKEEFTAGTIAGIFKERIGLKKKRNTKFWEVVSDMLEQAAVGVPKKRDGTIKKSGNTLYSSYARTAEVLRGYEQKHGALNFDSFNVSFEDKFKSYMLNSYDFNINTCGKHFKTLKTFLNQATKDGLNKYQQYKGYSVVLMDPQEDSVALTSEEVDRIRTVELKEPHLQVHRDLFIVSCYTGMRYSDYSSLKPHNFKDGFIEKVLQKGRLVKKGKQKKAAKAVLIPIHPKLLPIMEKYNYELPKVPHNQVTNRYLKDIGRLAGIDDIVHYEVYKIDRVIEMSARKWELITTHTGRRTLATQLHESGFPDMETMKITGHTDYRSFLRYIRTKPQKTAQMLKDHEGFKNL